MERLHPNKRQVAFALRVLVLACLAGCSNQQMSASNPFMAPDRVPPPATRPIAPGTAAPYYPGDPVPAAQNAPPASPMLVQAQPTAVPQPLQIANERSVAIPSDDEKLRFALPSPPPIPQAQPQLVAAPEPAPQVIPAAYNQPVALQPAPVAAPVPAATTDNNSSGPWRPPQVPNSYAPVTQAQYVQPQRQLQPTPAAPSMPVELRAVPSPMTAPPTAPTMTPVGPAMTPPPRMRFPSWTSPSTWFTPQPAGNQQLIGYMIPGPNGAMQMVSVEQMQALSAGTAQPATSVAGSDGFRPRGSATK